MVTFLKKPVRSNQDISLQGLTEHLSRLKKSPAGYADWDAISVNADFCNSSVQGKMSSRNTLSDWEGRRKFAGGRGFFYAVTESIRAVKFGPGRGLAASAAVETTYREAKQIGNLLREVADGQEVRFDAAEVENNTWIATLVWIGQRPAKPPIGDSEDIFINRITNKIFGSSSLSRGKPVASGDCSGEKTVHNVGAGSLPVPRSIYIYKDSKGVIVQTRAGSATCEVRELTATRKIEFTSECFYKDSTVFNGDLNEVLRQGDPVFLDYVVGVKGKKEQTVCGLVWQGRKPRDVRKISPEVFRKRLEMDSQDAESSLCFKDLETDIERDDEASRGTSPVPSDPELREDTVLSRDSGVSSSVVVAGLLAGLPAATSTPACTRSPGTHNEPSACESTSELSFLSAGVDVLRRVAGMVAEIVAQKESLRTVLRDVGVQTIDEGPSSSPKGTLFVPDFVDASTQTLSTGEIISGELFVS